MVKGGEIGDFGGGSLEHPRQWLGAQWPDLTLGVPSCPEPPGAPLGGTGAELGHCQGGTLTMLRHWQARHVHRLRGHGGAARDRGRGRAERARGHLRGHLRARRRVRGGRVLDDHALSLLRRLGLRCAACALPRGRRQARAHVRRRLRGERVAAGRGLLDRDQVQVLDLRALLALDRQPRGAGRRVGRAARRAAVVREVRHAAGEAQGDRGVEAAEDVLLERALLVALVELPHQPAHADLVGPPLTLTQQPRAPAAQARAELARGVRPGALVLRRCALARLTGDLLALVGLTLLVVVRQPPGVVQVGHGLLRLQQPRVALLSGQQLLGDVAVLCAQSVQLVPHVVKLRLPVLLHREEGADEGHKEDHLHYEYHD
eukprot:scaffold58190_cov64-Phaeocystis_antarctica.AAC.2